MKCVADGIVGIIGHERTVQVSEGEVADLARAYESLRGTAKRLTAHAGGFACIIGFASRASEDVRLPDDAVSDGPQSWMIVSGTPHGLRDTIAPDASGLDGQFVCVSYDAARDELSVATDAFGMQAVFLAERDRKTYFSTSALALAKHMRAKPSRLGLNVFLRAGYQFGAVTNWEGIERVDPATRVCFTAGGRARDVYWRPSIDESVTRLSLAEASRYCTEVAIDTYHSSFVSHRRGWADLTGGYDSRLMCLLLRSGDIDFAVNTVGSEDNPDARIASHLADIAGWQWQRFNIPDDWHEILPGLMQQSVGWGDCHLDAIQLAEVLWSHMAKARVFPNLFNGGGGEHFQSYAWQQEFLNVGRSNHVNLDNWVNMMMMRPVDTRLFATDPTPEVRDDLRARMAAHAEPYSSHLNTAQLDIMYAYKSTGHFGAYISAASGLLKTELPFYLKPVFNAAFSTSYRHRIGHRLMRSMIEALDPRVAAVSTMKGGPAQPLRLTNLHRFLPYYALLGRKAVTKLSDYLLGRPLLMPHAPSDPIRAMARQSVVNELGEGRRLQAETMRSASLFKADALNSLLSRAGEPGLEDATLLQRTLTIEMALRAADTSVES